MSSHGWSLGDFWHTQNNAIFDNVPEHDVDTYDNFNLLNEITYSLFAIDATSSSRIDKTFGKSFMLMYMMNLIGEAHSPFNNVNKFSSKHKDGDNFGKDYKVGGSQSNIHDLWGNGLGLFSTMKFPLSMGDEVKGYANEILRKYSRDNLSADLKDDSKKSWSDHAKDIAINNGYTLAEGATPSTSYLEEGKELLMKQIALAGFRVSDQVAYCFSKQ